jgi:hypothetical protein
LIFNISHQAETETTPKLTYNYDATNHILTVDLLNACPFLYILIDETTKPIRVSKDEQLVWNDPCST